MREPVNIGDLLTAGRLKKHTPSRAEVSDLLAIADRRVRDAAVAQLSSDGRFASAYGASLSLVTIVVVASGYRVGQAAGHHRLTIDLLPALMGEQERARAVYLDACRRKRNLGEYERSGVVTEAEARALADAATGLRADVIAWLETGHPELAPE